MISNEIPSSRRLSFRSILDLDAFIYLNAPILDLRGDSNYLPVIIKMCVRFHSQSFQLIIADLPVPKVTLLDHFYAVALILVDLSQ